MGEAWNACRHPERPPDDDVCYHDDCRACLIAMHAGMVTTFGPGQRMRHDTGREATAEEVLADAGIVLPVGGRA